MYRSKEIGPCARISATMASLLKFLRILGEHLNDVVVYAIVELALEGPGKLRMVQIARMHLVVIRMQTQRFVPEVDDDLDAIVAVFPRIKREQRMFVGLELLLHPRHAFIHGGHLRD